VGTKENRRGLGAGCGEIHSNQCDAAEERGDEREGPETPPDSPALDLSDAAVKKLIRTAKKRGYGSREPRFRPAGRASGVDCGEIPSSENPGTPGEHTLSTCISST
jgi:hypothetical protein